MKIQNPKIDDLGETSVKLTFAISGLSLQEIKQNGYFNYNEDLFDNPLPEGGFSVGVMSVISSRAVFDNSIKIKNDFDINGKEWQILYAQMDGVTHSTFFNLVENFDSAEAYIDAAVAFAARKAAIGSHFSGEKIGLLEGLLKKLIVKAGSVRSMGSNEMASMAGELITEMFKVANEERFSIHKRIEDFLENKGIPVDFSEGSFYFTATYENKTWDVEISWLDADNLVVAYSSIPINLDEEALPSFLNSMNELNVANDCGNYQCSMEYNRLYFKNAFFIIESSLESQLNWLTENSFQNMVGIIAIIDKLVVK